MDSLYKKKMISMINLSAAKGDLKISLKSFGIYRVSPPKN